MRSCLRWCAWLSAAVCLGCATTPPGRSTTPSAAESAAELRARARIAYCAGANGECTTLFARARALTPERAPDAYDAACCHALAGDADGGFARLDAALEAGFRNEWQLGRDPDLQGLHTDARWEAALAHVRSHAIAYVSRANPELMVMFREDQADRAAGPRTDWSVVGPRDAERRERARELLEEGRLAVAADYYHAAMILQHGADVGDFDLASRLARRAVELDSTDEPARWLAAAAMDRALMTAGKPQRYGTQSRKVDNRWELYQVEPGVSDEERAQWNVPPLECSRRQVDQMNGGR